MATGEFVGKVDGKLDTAAVPNELEAPLRSIIEARDEDGAEIGANIVVDKELDARLDPTVLMTGDPAGELETGIVDNEVAGPLNPGLEETDEPAGELETGIVPTELDSLLSPKLDE